MTKSIIEDASLSPKPHLPCTRLPSLVPLFLLLLLHRARDNQLAQQQCKEGGDGSLAREGEGGGGRGEHLEAVVNRTDEEETEMQTE